MSNLHSKYPTYIYHTCIYDFGNEISPFHRGAAALPIKPGKQVLLSLGDSGAAYSLDYYRL